MKFYELMAKCQNLEKIGLLSHRPNNSYELNGIELCEELNTNTMPLKLQSLCLTNLT